MQAGAIRVVVTGAAGQIAYSLISSIAKGDVFGSNQTIRLHLLDIEQMMGVLEGVVMEMDDCAFPLLEKVVATADVTVAFDCVDVAFLVGAMPRREGMERKDLLAANVKIFKAQGDALDKHAKKEVKVLVVGNPANTNAYICRKYAPSIPPENFSALTRLDQNRAQAQIARQLGVNIDSVKNVIIWGNHSSTQFPDVAHASVNGKNAKEAVANDNFLNGDFIKIVQTRGAAVIKARKLSSAMSAAKAICDHMRDWWHGTKPGEFVSMGVVSDGSYGIADGLLFSYPVSISADRKYTIIKDLDISDLAREKLNITQKELLEERDMALTVCQD